MGSTKDPRGGMPFEAYALSSGYLYRIAREAYGRTHGVTSDIQPGQDNALIAILFSAAALEAWIMDFGHAASQAGSKLHAIATMVEEAEEIRGSALTKFQWAKLLLDGRGYDKGKAPFQDFALLMDLRNGIVHLKPERMFESTSKTMAALQDRKLWALDRTDPMRSRISLISTRAAARWACNVVIDMIDSIRYSAPADLTPLVSAMCMGRSFKRVE
jgi:hypothetical protein